MNKILYISPLSSNRLINSIHISTGNNFVFAVQKFNRLIVQGLVQNGSSVEIYSKPPVNEISRGWWVSIPNEIEDGLTYNYINYFNIPVLKDIIVFIKSFVKVFAFGFFDKGSKCVVCDVLSVSLNLGAVLASKIVGVKIAGIVTDMPGLLVNSSTKQKKSLMNYMHHKLNKQYIGLYTHYIFLTEQMNNVININNRPYIVMEALCNHSLTCISNQPVAKADPKIILYAGGLHEKYGLKLLVDGFRMITRPDIKLVIYGSGPYADELKTIVLEDSRIEYRGVANNEEVLKAELEASLLVNPRPTTEEFTKYSFPSKNMEYMASGTAVLTTKLPGMPEDYYQYVYVFEEENAKGYADVINSVLNIDTEELIAKGQAAKNYVLQNKNYIVQTKRLLALINCS